MKIAVLSDIHGNLPALQAVLAHVEAWQPDQVIVAGDIVNRGPLSRDCLRLVQARQQTEGWQMIRGNHEDYLIACARPDFPLSGPRFQTMQFAYWAYQQLNGEVADLAALPDQISVTAPGNSEFRVVHGSMRGNRDGTYVNSAEDELRAQVAPPPAVLITAHTHRPFIRCIDDTLVVNVGSVGAPFDQDKRAGYGQFTWSSQGWQANVVRLAYDCRQTERDYIESGFLEEAGPLAQLMLIELRKARGLIYRWASRYEKAVLAGQITMEASVRQLLQDEDLQPYLGYPGWT